MKRLLAFAMLLPLLATAGESAAPVVAVTGGSIQGALLSAPGGAVFKGIPYAAPPLGELRWREPAAVKSWSGVRDASAFGASCVQQILAWNQQEAAGNQEDCLYLNVWTPQWPVRTKLPVMFWIHGGGNTGGGASVDYFDGTSLSRRGVVVVTINYRLGVFGYLAHPALTAESAHRSAGNYGLLDQLAALRWVRENITRFGGDPENVTVFGQSAGSRNTGFLLASPLSKGLIHKAIQESGVPIQPVMLLRDAEQAGARFAAGLGAPGNEAGLRQLRALPVQELLKAAVAASRANELDLSGPPVDDWFMPMDAAYAFAAGKQLAVPLLIGSNAREQRGPEPAALRKAVADAFGVNAEKALAYYGLNVEGEGHDDPLYGSATTQFWADSRQRCESVQEAIWHASAGNAVYQYQFDLPVPGRPATQHSAELPFVFGNLLPGGFLGGPATEADRKVSGDLQAYWTNFARSGDPNGAGLPVWPRFNPEQRSYLAFTAGGPVVANHLRREICELYMGNLRHQMQR